MGIGIIVGRFQVPALTLAHKELIKEVQGKVAEPVIFLGVSKLDGRVREHPYTFQQRVQIIREACYQKIPIFPLLDRRDNADWTRSIEDMIDYLYPDEKVTIFVGSSSEVPACFTSERTEVKSIGLMSLTTGTMVRNGLTLQSSLAFRQGQAYALSHQFPSVHPTVDIAMYKGNTVLLIQRQDTGVWCFPGGFVDPQDASFEHAARREFLEETGLSVEHSLQYLGTFPIHDWRYRRCRQDSIMTTLFLTEYSFGSDHQYGRLEVREMKWVPVKELLDHIAMEHEPLAKKVMETLF